MKYAQLALALTFLFASAPSWAVDNQAQSSIGNTALPPSHSPESVHLARAVGRIMRLPPRELLGLKHPPLFAAALAYSELVRANASHQEISKARGVFKAAAIAFVNRQSSVSSVHQEPATQPGEELPEDANETRSVAQRTALLVASQIAHIRYEHGGTPPSSLEDQLKVSHERLRTNLLKAGVPNSKIDRVILDLIDYHVRKERWDNGDIKLGALEALDMRMGAGSIITNALISN